MNKKVITNSVLLSLLISSSLWAETDVVTTIGVGPLNIDTTIQDSISYTDVNGNGRVTNDRKSSIDSSGAELGVTVVNEGWYMGFSTMLVGQSASDYSNHYVQTYTNTAALNLDEFAGNPETMSVTSYSGYLGKSLGDSLRVYGG